MSTVDFRPDVDFALAEDAADPLRTFRGEFEIPRGSDGSPVIYLAGNSLGLQPLATRGLMRDELDMWAEHAVEGHFLGDTPWYSYHQTVREPAARLVGAESDEVVMMNSLTVNLHLMMVSFFRPQGTRCKILIDWPVFPSDLYAVKTHLRTRGLDPDDALIIQRPRDGEHTLRTEDLEATLAEHGESIALVLLAGVNFYTGQLMDMARLTQAAHTHGCIVGFDLAHAAGNVAMQLHDWDVDFACWCSYKYLNSGPGAVAGCFVHRRHAADASLPRYGGWWGNDPDTRFRMHLEPDFVPKPDADGWQLSNPSILAMTPVRASLALFDRAGMASLCEKSRRLTGYLRQLIERRHPDWFEIITPAAPDAHGCQLSILVHDRPTDRFAALRDAGVVCDYREPNVIRAAPVPLYNSFHDAWRFAEILVNLPDGR